MYDTSLWLGGKDISTANWHPDGQYLSLSSDGRLLAIADFSGESIIVREVRNGDVIHRFAMDPKNFCIIRSIFSWLHQGRYRHYSNHL